MVIVPWRNRFWRRWIAANSIAELLGLGGVASLGFIVVSRFGEPQGVLQSLAFAALFTLMGAFEGFVVGLAQAKVLQQRLPELKGWVKATVIGAVVAWALGMVPSTIMSIIGSDASGSPPEISEPMRLLLAAGLGFVAGPLLAFFQWRCLRHYVTHALLWLPANAVAWALGMPIIFIGVHVIALTPTPALLVSCVGLSLLAAGAIVGAVHGHLLIWLLSGREG